MDNQQDKINKGGAPKGNSNSKRGMIWRDAIARAIANATDGRDATLARLASALIAKAEEGDMIALKEIGDRLDGKPRQQVALEDADGNNLTVQIVQFAALKNNDEQ